MKKLVLTIVALATMATILSAGDRVTFHEVVNTVKKEASTPEFTEKAYNTEHRRAVGGLAFYCEKILVQNIANKSLTLENATSSNGSLTWSITAVDFCSNLPVQMDAILYKVSEDLGEEKAASMLLAMSVYTAYAMEDKQVKGGEKHQALTMLHGHTPGMLNLISKTNNLSCKYYYDGKKKQGQCLNLIEKHENYINLKTINIAESPEQITDYVFSNYRTEHGNNILRFYSFFMLHSATEPADKLYESFWKKFPFLSVVILTQEKGNRFSIPESPEVAFNNLVKYTEDY